jgi:hypothetical protein
MDKQDYSYSFTTKVDAEVAFDAINRVQEWWTSNLEGNSHKLNDVFTVHFGDIFVTIKITDFIPGKKTGWLVTDCDLQWLKDKKEWKDTKIKFEISSEGNETQICMTHLGLVPEIECYEDCKQGWNFHIGESLFKLITQGVGIPNVSTRKTS